MQLTRRPLARRGLTLVELLVTLVVLGVVASALTGVVVRQQRVNARTAALVDVRGQGRFALSALVSELRGVSPIGGDIIAISATDIRFRAPIGASVICDILAGRTTFRLPPAQPIRTTDVNSVPVDGVLLTSFVDPSALPTSNDFVWAFDATLPASDPNPWARRTVTTQTQPAPGNGNQCPSTNNPGGFLTPAEVGKPVPSYTVTIDTPLPDSVKVGSPVRFTREVRYSFQQDALGDGFWYLFYEECVSGGACGTARPVAGPFRESPVGTPVANQGLRFLYFDQAGNATTVPASVARVEIVTQAVSRESLSNGSSARAPVIQKDSVTVALRNRT